MRRRKGYHRHTDPADVINLLKQHAGFFEVYQEVSFEAYRHAENGEVQKVNVKILDAGPGAGQERYMCIATSEDGKVASGNPSDHIDVALLIVHWHELDR